MDKAAFARIRALLGKSQRELASLLGVSLKAVESYEQGWRNIPPNTERMLYLFFFKMNQAAFAPEMPCWAVTSCSEEARRDCVAYAMGEGHFCWFFTGGLCAFAHAFAHASAHASGEGERLCHRCKVFSRLKALVEHLAEGRAAIGSAIGPAAAPAVAPAATEESTYDIAL
jgi:hypothetical protein